MIQILTINSLIKKRINNVKYKKFGEDNKIKKRYFKFINKKLNDDKMEYTSLEEK